MSSKTVNVLQPAPGGSFLLMPDTNPLLSYSQDASGEPLH